MELLHAGKVRDVYTDGDELILVASDRISVYDVVLPTPIPDKGKLLTALSLWWFDRLADVIDNHVVSATEVPEEFAGRAIRCRRLEMLPVECVARGYLAGSGLKDYRRDGRVSGVALPTGLVDGSRLPEPIFTPSTKAPIGEHDAPMTFDEVAEKLGPDTASRLRDITLDVYRRGRDIAARRGIIVADTKIELGLDSSGALVLADEVLTGDSSRFWPSADWEPGGPQPSFDKQYLRDWAAGSGWDKSAPPPRIPEEVVAATRAKYIEAYERITGVTWDDLGRQHRASRISASSAIVEWHQLRKDMPMNQTGPVSQALPTERDDGPFNPPSRLTRLREARPASPMTFPDGHEGWIVTGYEAVRQVLADTRFSSRQDIGILHTPYDIPGMPVLTEPPPPDPGMFLQMDPPDHTRIRSMLTGAFTVKRMKLLEEHIIEIVERQLDDMARLTPPVDLVQEFALPIPSLVICELLGVPYEDRAGFQDDSSKILNNDLPFDEQMAAFNDLTTFLRELVARKRSAPGEDLLSGLARRDDITDEELTGVAFLLLVAGHETTANMLALGTFALLEHPGQLAGVRADPDLMPGAVDELMRFLSIADIFFRYATEDIEVAGETINRDSTVVISLLTANHDPKKFDDPDTLDIRRNARGYLSFGHGIHQCLGQQLARIEMRAGFDALLRRIPRLRLAVPAADVPLKTKMQIYGVHELPVTWDEVAR